jgi:hypothetical protein
LFSAKAHRFGPLLNREFENLILAPVRHAARLPTVGPTLASEEGGQTSSSDHRCQMVNHQVKAGFVPAHLANAVVKQWGIIFLV